MKVGDTIVYKADSSSTGVIVRVEQYGNTPTYLIEWVGKCPTTGYDHSTYVLKTDIEVASESR